MFAFFMKSFVRTKQNHLLVKRWKNTGRQVVIYDPFVNIKTKDKQTYLELVKVFEGQDHRRRGHVEFIYAALVKMKEFGVHKDLEAYKALINVFPKGRFIPTNIFQAEFMHYPKQQQCAVDLLEQMEDNGVMPDVETEDILLNIFGRRGFALRKYWRMMYWMPKFKNLSPWALPEELPKDTLELALLAIHRITSVDADTKVEVLQTEDIEASLDKTWIVSAQSPVQKKLLSEQPPDEPLVIKGPYNVYLKEQAVTYFTLLGKIRPDFIDNTDTDDVSTIEKPTGIPGYMDSAYLPAVKSNSVHEQDDGTVLSVCATGTSSRDSLLSWVRLLEKNDNPLLSTLPVIFTLVAPPTDLSTQETQPDAREPDKEHTK